MDTKLKPKRYRVLRGYWLSRDAAENSPPSSLLDTPQEVRCFATFRRPKRRYSRPEALKLAAHFNQRQLARGCDLEDMLWHVVAENLGYRFTETVVIIDDGECFEDQFRRHKLRIVQPTPWEIAKHGQAGFVASLRRGVAK